jgi:hypothetical protein
MGHSTLRASPYPIPTQIVRAADFAYNLDTNKGMVGDGYMRQLEPVISSMPYNGLFRWRYFGRGWL